MNKLTKKQNDLVEDALINLTQDSNNSTLELSPYSMRDRRTLQALQNRGFVLDFEEIRLANGLPYLSANWSVQTLLNYQNQTNDPTNTDTVSR